MSFSLTKFRVIERVLFLSKTHNAHVAEIQLYTDSSIRQSNDVQNATVQNEQPGIIITGSGSNVKLNRSKSGNCRSAEVCEE